MKQYTPGEWHKATYSANGSHCVEAREYAGGAAVRDTQNRDLGHLEFQKQEWAALLRALTSK